jgi:transposase
VVATRSTLIVTDAHTRAQPGTSTNLPALVSQNEEQRRGNDTGCLAPPLFGRLPLAVRGLVTELLRRVAQLEERLNQTSRNSSKPPSSDPPGARPRATRAPTGRKAGGQPGHEGHGRKLKPEREVDQIIDVRPEQGGQCGALLLGADTEPERPQVTEIPRLALGVTEYRRHCLWCVACGVRTQAAWPTTMPSGSFEPRVQAPVGDLTGRIGASQREVPEIFATRYQADVSVGSIGALEQAVSAALAIPVAEVQTDVQRQPVRNADETRWCENGKRRGVWISVTPLVTSFRLLKTRGAAEVKVAAKASFSRNTRQLLTLRS